MRATLPPGSEPAREYAVIKLRVAEVTSRTRPRLTALLVIDVSGSMQGEPLAHVVRSAERLVDILGDGDALGVVSFDDAAHTIAEVRPLDVDGRRGLKAELARLAADGRTNLSDGMARALMLFPVREPHERQIALVMSDGQPNVGTCHADGLAREASLLKRKGVAISTLGFGALHDETGPWRPMRVAVEGRPVGGERDVVRGELAMTLDRLGPYDTDVEVGAHGAVALASEARDEARGLADRGNDAGAAEVLRRARRALEESAGFTDGPEAVRENLRDACEALIDDITAMENRPDQESYARYRKTQFAYAAFASPGPKGRQGTPLVASPAAEDLTKQLLLEPLPAAHLVILTAGQRCGVIRLDRAEMIVGRTGDNQIQVACGAVSRRHTRIHFHDGAFWAIDLGSTNGTVVNGEPVAVKALRHGDVISYAEHCLEYRDGPPEP